MQHSELQLNPCVVIPPLGCLFSFFLPAAAHSRTPRRGRRPKVGCFLWWTNVLEKKRWVASSRPGSAAIVAQLRRAAAAATRALCKGAFAPLIPHPFQSCGFPTLIPFIPPQSSTCHGRRRLQFRDFVKRSAHSERPHGRGARLCYTSQPSQAASLQRQRALRAEGWSAVMCNHARRFVSTAHSL